MEDFQDQIMDPKRTAGAALKFVTVLKIFLPFPLVWGDLLSQIK